MRKVLASLILAFVFIALNNSDAYSQTGNGVELAGHVDLPQVVKSVSDYKSEWLWTGAHFTTLRLRRLRTGGVGIALSESSPLLVVPLANVAIFQLVSHSWLEGASPIFELDFNINYVRNLKRKDNGVAVGLSIAF